MRDLNNVSRETSQDNLNIAEVFRFCVTTQPLESEWKCELFGGSNFIWRPRKEQVPNGFWRLMQFLVFGNRWKRDRL